MIYFINNPLTYVQVNAAIETMSLYIIIKAFN